MFISARVPSRPHTFHAREKEFSSDKKEKEQPFFPRCHLLLVLFAKCPEFGKKKKNLSRYHRSWEGKKQESKTASSLFRFSKSNKPKRKQTGRCAEAQGLVVVGSKSPKSRRAKRIPFSFGSPPQSKAAIVKRPCCFG